MFCVHSHWWLYVETLFSTKILHYALSVSMKILYYNLKY